MKGRVVKSTGMWYRVLLEDGQWAEARLRGKLKLDDKKITNPIAVGDWVWVEVAEKGDKVISSILPRENYVIRASPRKKGHSHLIASNVDQAVLIASQKSPRTSLGFIDRFFITLETFRIPGKLIINKSDLYSKEEMEALGTLADLYSSLGYPTVITSFSAHGARDVADWFTDKTTLLSGHSGTGKSTLINLLVPDAVQGISDISTFADKGVHTTTFAEMFSIDGHSYLIDTPGIKELGLAEIEPEELSHYFTEMRDLLGSCRYHNCLHVNEPGCSIQDAVREGKIALSRFQSYLSMMERDDNRR
ncbi:MAG: ribosome small subunit-dependent GTPase A [Cyclobacteriaceae bacterium]|nr:ribosome small subunit-dependent GTPase A [Cyclobacteriaceae bacterium]